MNIDRNIRYVRILPSYGTTIIKEDQLEKELDKDDEYDEDEMEDYETFTHALIDDSVTKIEI